MTMLPAAMWTERPRPCCTTISTQIIFGAMESDDMNDEMKVTVIAAGFDDQDIGDAMELDTKTTISAAQADEVDSSRRRRSSASDDFDVPTFLQNRK